jgi:2-keto-4-pentenoate hydratase/2-oxohepta-3-ene-1,7-dioic acid hydratase in catechol pathway
VTLGSIRRFARVELGDGSRRFVELDAGGAWLLDHAPWDGGARSSEPRIEGLDEQGRGAGVRRLAPVAPSKILAIGRNYRAHASELGNEVPAEPLLFMKPPSALLEPDGTIELPPTRLSQRIEHEVELGLVIGARCRGLGPENAESAIFGYTIVGDITARDLQRSDGQWTRAKGFDTFCPVGPVVVSGIDASALAIRCSVSGELRQEGSTRDMVFSPAAIVAFASEVMTLEPGDVIATGTPAGVGPLRHGDRVEMAVEGIGELWLTVRSKDR